MHGPASSLCVLFLPLEHPSLLLLLPLLLPYQLAVFAGPPPVHATAQWQLSPGHKFVLRFSKVLDLLVCCAQCISQHFQLLLLLLLLLLHNYVLLLLLNCINCLGCDIWLLLNRRFRPAAAAQHAQLLSCCWLELQLLICCLLAVAIKQVRGPPCIALLSPELLKMLCPGSAVSHVACMPYFLAHGCI